MLEKKRQNQIQFFFRVGSFLCYFYFSVHVLVSFAKYNWILKVVVPFLDEFQYVYVALRSGVIFWGTCLCYEFECEVFPGLICYN